MSDHASRPESNTQWLPPAFAFAWLLIPAMAIAQGGTTRLGDPSMTIVTAKIAPPYHTQFDLPANSAGWPSLANVVTANQTQRDATGRIVLSALYNSHPSLRNLSTVWSNDAGVFGAETRMEDPSAVASYVGTFASAHWAQSFRKDSVSSHLNVSITGAELYVRGLGGESRAEFTFDVTAARETGSFFHDRETAGLRITPGVPYLVTQSIEGSIA